MALVAALTAALALSTALGYVFFQVWAPEAYMDEIFHVPQTQRYCAGRWAEWDDKITTFPGLYFLGAIFGQVLPPLAAVLGFQAEVCGTASLRAVNAVFAVACGPLFYQLARALDPSRTERQAALLAAACAIFPLHYFYAFLYYTDVPSLFFTLAAYLATKKRQGGLAAGLAATAVLMRQTNAVWVAFMLGEAALDRCQPEIARSGSGSGGGGTGRGKGEAERLEGPPRGSAGGSSGSGGRRRRWQADGEGLPAAASEGAGPAAAAVGGSLAQQVSLLLRRAWVLKWELAQQLWGLAAVVAAFAGFVVWNGGVVVGDRSHHSPVRHLVQPLYFTLYATLWLAPVFWSPGALWADLRTAARRGLLGWAAWGASCAGLAAAVRRATLVHPFLLADNRHYVFYLWRKVVNRRWWARYALVPLYTRSLAALAGRLEHKGPLWAALFWLATCLVLVPAHLIEFRYFTVPFCVLALNMRAPSSRQLALVILGYAAVNALTVWVYLRRPFIWGDGSVARFLW